MPKLTVTAIVPAYNARGFITQTIEAAARQDVTGYQVLVSDDASTDGTGEEAERVAAEFPGLVTVLRSDTRRGLTANYSRLLARVDTDLVAFCDGDDFFLPGKIRAQRARFEEDPELVLCGHDVNVVDESGTRVLYRYAERFPLVRGRGAEQLVSRGVLFCPCAVMVRTSAIRDNRFDHRFKHIADWWFFIQCLAAGGKYDYVDGIYACYRSHAGQVTSRWSQSHREDQLITLGLCEANFPHLAEACAARRKHLFGELAWWHDAEGRRESAVQYASLASGGTAAEPRPCPPQLLETHRKIEFPFLEEDSGNGFIGIIGQECCPGDTSAEPFRSPLLLLEDHLLLGPAHCPHEDIRERGAGRYSHWDPSGVVFFSASDNTDPRTNGRNYAVLIPQRPMPNPQGVH